jgi:hypothetical protein
MLPASKAISRDLEEGSEEERWKNESDEDEWDDDEEEYYESFKKAEMKALMRLPMGEALAQMKDAKASMDELAFKRWEKKKFKERMLAQDGSHIQIQDVCGLCSQNIIKERTMGCQPVRGDEIMACKDAIPSHQYLFCCSYERLQCSIIIKIATIIRMTTITLMTIIKIVYLGR